MGTKRNMIETEKQEGGTLKERREECIKRFEKEEKRAAKRKSVFRSG